MTDAEIIREQLNNILAEESDVALKNYYDEASRSYDDFEEYTDKIGEGYSCPDYPFFDQKIEGLTPGLYLFAARSNVGKTATMTNLMWSYCMNPDNHLFGIYYSLDDARHDVISRLMSMLESIPISCGAKPKRYLEEIERLKHEEDAASYDKQRTLEAYMVRRKNALETLRASNQRFLVVDSDEITSFEALVSHAKKVQTFVKSIDPRNDIMIAVDSVFDLTFSETKFRTRDEEARETSRRLKRLYEDMRIPVFGSCHLRKLGSERRRPVQDDLKDSGRLQYDATVIFLLHNDVSENKQNAKVYFGNPPEIQPVIEMDWSKNKHSSYKGVSYFYFQPEYSRIQEASEADFIRYDAARFSR